MRTLLIPIAVLVGVLSLVGCSNALTEEQIREIVRDEASQIKQGPRGEQGVRGPVGARGPAGTIGGVDLSAHSFVTAQIKACLKDLASTTTYLTEHSSQVSMGYSPRWLLGRYKFKYCP